MEMDGNGWKWMEMDGNRWKWMEMDGNGMIIAKCLYVFLRIIPPFSMFGSTVSLTAERSWPCSYSYIYIYTCMNKERKHSNRKPPIGAGREILALTTIGRNIWLWLRGLETAKNNGNRPPKKEINDWTGNVSRSQGIETEFDLWGTSLCSYCHPPNYQRFCHI